MALLAIVWNSEKENGFIKEKLDLSSRVLISPFFLFFIFSQPLWFENVHFRRKVFDRGVVYVRVCGLSM